ncbi:peptidogalycan biosysnthesis protein, partial [Rhizobiaceae sp. 2RAB30]
DFLTALEESGCAVARAGWQGHHLRLEASDGRLVGAVPCYVKSHSQGEYVFDHGWADALERAGGQVVFHLHVHILPRFEGVALKPHTGQMEKPEVLVANAEKIRAALSEA